MGRMPPSSADTAWDLRDVDGLISGRRLKLRLGRAKEWRERVLHVKRETTPNSPLN